MKAKIKNAIKIASGVSLVIMTMGTLFFGTYAWFTSTAPSVAPGSPSTGTLTTKAPPGAEFFYFKGNGTPGDSTYTGYSKSGAAFGNTTNLVDTSTSKFSVNSGSAYATIDNPILDQNGSDTEPIDPADSTAWGWIDKESVSTSPGVASPANCFNFSKMRPGCHYSFCAVFSGVSHITLRLTTGTSGATVAGNKRYVYSSGRTAYPVNFAMAMNAYVKPSTNSGGPTYINSTVTPASYPSSDKIVWENSYTTYHDFDLLSGESIGGKSYIYFTIFMGLPDQTDALLLRDINGSDYYYQRGTGEGNYAPYEGLTTTITSLELS